MARPILYVLITTTVAIAIIVWLFGAGGYDSLLYGDHYVDQRKTYWKDVVSRELPIGSTQSSIERWADSQSFSVYHSADKRQIQITLQTIPWHQVVCKEWNIIATISMEGERSIDENVVSMGACL